MLDLLFPTVFQGPLQLVASVGILFVAQVVYVVFGFGSGLIAVGTLALLFADFQDVVVLLSLVNFPAEVGIVLKSWREITWRRAGLLLGGIIAGVPIGIHVLKTGQHDPPRHGFVSRLIEY